METTAEQLGRLETPTARLVLSVDAPREVWLGARRNGITATDLPAIVGLSQYRSAIDVWTDKTMPPADPQDAGEAAFWGMKLEEPVAQAWAERHGVKIRRVGIVANVEHPWMLASLDRLVTGCFEGRCALEVKTRSLFVSDAWDKAVPDDVRAQVMWQLAVTGLDHIHVAALIGGQRLVDHVIYPDPAEIERLTNAASIVWTAVEHDEMPDLPPELWSTEYLEARHPDREGSVQLEDRDTVAAYLAYIRISDEISDLEKEKAELRTRLIGALGDADTATIDSKPVYTYKPSTRRNLNAKALGELYPDAAGDDRVWNVTTSRTLRITSKGTDK